MDLGEQAILTESGARGRPATNPEANRKPGAVDPWSVACRRYRGSARETGDTSASKMCPCIMTRAMRPRKASM
jgi:hypothetical protein